MTRQRASRHQHAPRASLGVALASLAGGFFGIAAIGLIDQAVLPDTDMAFVIGAFGATAVLVFGAPGSPLAHPWNVVTGHLLSAVIGVAAVQLLGPGWLAAAAAVGLAIFAMQMSRSLHPSGGASALIAVAGTQSVHDLGWIYLFFPVGAGALVLAFVALVVNNIGPGRRWPIFWY